MNNVTARTLTGALLAVALVLAAPPAAANDKAECTAALKAAQAERTDRKLTKAIADFATCARPVCPKGMQKQCTNLSQEAVSAQPSVVFSAKDASGKAVTNVTVSVDGTVVASTLDGQPITVDPGTHAMKFEMEGATTVNKDVVVAETEKSQPVAIDLDANPPPAPIAVVVAPAEGAGGSDTDTIEDPTKRYYFIGLRYRGDIIPQFMLNIFVNGGKTLYSNTVGLELDMRKDNFSLIPALSYTEYGTGDVVFSQKGNDPTQASNWSVVNSSLAAIYASVDLLWSVKINSHWAFEYGAGFGLGVIFGDLENNWVYPRTGTQISPTNYIECQKVTDNPSCQPGNHQNASVAKVGGYVEPSWAGGGSIPNVFPAINFPQIGVRYKPMKQLEARFETGFSLTGFWFGLAANYGLEKHLAK